MVPASRPIGPETSVVAVTRQVSVDLGEEVLILHLSTAGYYSVRNVAARIWHLLGSPIRVSEIAATLAGEYGVPPERCEADVLELLADLVDRDLVKVLA